MKTQTIDPREIRKSAIAGTFYPGDPHTLEATVDDFLTRTNAAAKIGDLIALLSPHAGYPYSGQTAAYAYAQLRDQKFDTVVLIGPSHFEDFGPFAISARKFYSTPLGEVELDQHFISALAARIPLTRVEQEREHSLEIQLPFLQRALGDFKLVPIMMTRPFYIVGPEARTYCDQLSQALADLAREKKILFVASSDLSHLEDYGAVKRFDARFAQLIQAFDVDGLADYMWRTGECRACGDAPIVTTLLTAQKLGADRVEIFHQTNSGDVTGEREHASYVVGYLAAGIYRNAKVLAHS